MFHSQCLLNHYDDMLIGATKHPCSSLTLMANSVAGGCWEFRVFAKKEKIKKSELTMEVGGWVQVSLDFFLENSPKPVLIFWSSIPCVFCLYIHC